MRFPVIRAGISRDRNKAIVDWITDLMISSKASEIYQYGNSLDRREGVESRFTISREHQYQVHLLEPGPLIYGNKAFIDLIPSSMEREHANRKKYYWLLATP